jgi:hypothetical protein
LKNKKKNTTAKAVVFAFVISVIIKLKSVMKKIFLIISVVLSQTVFAQNTFKAIIKSKTENETLIGATAIVQGTTNGASADANGFIEIKNIANGKQIIVFSYIGFESEWRIVSSGSQYGPNREGCTQRIRDK